MKPKLRHGLQAPQLPRHLPAGSLEQIGDQAEITSITVADCSLQNQAAEGLHVEQVRFRHVNFIAGRFAKLRLMDVQLEVCDLSAAQWEESRLRRVEFAGCRLWGIDLYKALFEDVLLHDCNGESAIFAGATFKAARFEQCNLHNVSFAEADLTGVVFQRCDLTQADLRGAKLQGADLRGSIVDGLQVGAETLRGVIVEPAQAIQIAELLGLIVKSRDEDQALPGQ